MSGLALNEKVRTVALLLPELLLTGKSEELIGKFEEKYLEVKARKQVYLNATDANAFFQFIPSAEKRAAVVESATRGLSEVVVIEHLDGEAIERTKALVEQMEMTELIFCSSSAWESARDLEFFFPHLDATPVQRTLALIKADALTKGQIDGKSITDVVEAAAAAAGLYVVGRKSLKPTADQAAVVDKDKDAVGVLTQDPGVTALCLEGPGAVGKWLLSCGPANSGVAKERAPSTIRALWGTDGTSNAVHGSPTMEAAEKEIKAFFPEGSLKLERTLCLVKPHAMPDLLAIKAEIGKAGFTVLAEKRTTLTEARAKEFFRDQATKSTFSTMVKEVCSGSCCILVLCRLEAVATLQQLMGPELVATAKETRPRSLRAVFGVDGPRNAVHGSDSAKSAVREVRFFFPQMGADPMPDDDEVRDFLFRKSAVSSMDLKALSVNHESSDYSVDPTMQQLLSQGLMALCQVQPKGLEAVKWLSTWLSDHDPNKPSVAAEKFTPPERTKRVVEFGVNPEGMPFSVEAPAQPQQKRIVEVDVTGETENNTVVNNTTAPYVVFVVGAPGSDAAAHCAKLAEEYNFIHLSLPDLMKKEVEACTYLGTEIDKANHQGKPVPTEILLPVIKKQLQTHKDTNRFLLEGFPITLDQAKRFEQEVATVSFVLHLSLSAAPEGQEQATEAFAQQSMPVIDYYKPIGKVRPVDAGQAADAVYAEVKKYFNCRFLYLMGPPGAPVSKVAGRLTEKYGYSSIDLAALLKTYSESSEVDAAKVKQALAKGKPVDASIACPLVLSEIYRDMALGITNFVICGFPQTLLQSTFVEHRIPSVSKPILLDFMRADAADLAAMVPDGTDAQEVELKMSAFFGKETQEMLKALPNLTKIPCSLAEVDTAQLGMATNTSQGLEGRLVDYTWEKVCKQVQPALTLVLGAAGSGKESLSPLLANLAPNCHTVDCNQLLDKEIERKTLIGVAMHNMLARGQVIPLSMTVELLKDLANLTCSDSLVVENCPTYADQIETLSKEFRLEKVFHVAPAGDDGGDLAPVVAHFSKLGKLERFAVETPASAEQLTAMLEQATMPQFAICTGLSAGLMPKLAEKLAATYNLSGALTFEQLQAWASGAGLSLAQDSPSTDIFAALKKYADSNGMPMMVLDRFPAKAEDAAAFVATFGAPKVVVNVTVADETVDEEYKAAHEDMEEETATANLAAMKEAYAATLKAFEEACPSSILTLNRADFKAEEVTVVVKEMCELVCKKLLPSIYVLSAPSYPGDFSGLVANSVCTSLAVGGRPAKFTLVDCQKLLQPGGHGPEMEDALFKASQAAESPDCLPTKIYLDLFKEAFATSANPMGTFLLTGFPTPSAIKASPPTVRDQFCVLESIASLEGIVHVTMTAAAFTQYCSDSQEDTAAYLDWENKVHDQMLVQLDTSKICEVPVDGGADASQAAAAVAQQFQAFLEKKG